MKQIHVTVWLFDAEKAELQVKFQDPYDSWRYPVKELGSEVPTKDMDLMYGRPTLHRIVRCFRKYRRDSRR